MKIINCFYSNASQGRNKMAKCRDIYFEYSQMRQVTLNIISMHPNIQGKSPYFLLASHHVSADAQSSSVIDTRDQ
jgi:hypothetical protein